MWDSMAFEKFDDLQSKVHQGGGKERIVKQHESGKLTARERLDILFDTDTFVEIDSLVEAHCTDYNMANKKVPGDGVITGYGLINGNIVFASSEDFTVLGGTLGEYHSLKICRMMDMALSTGAPMITINDSGGARIEEGISSLSGYAGIFLRNTNASGVIPQIAAIMGPCAGGACYSPAICDFIFMVDNTSHMFITGPQVVKTVTREEVTLDALGGAEMHKTQSGVVHFTYPDDTQCLLGIRKLLTYLPQNNTDRTATAMTSIKTNPPETPVNNAMHKLFERFSSSTERVDDVEISQTDLCYKLQDIVPQNPKKPYDIHQVIDCIIDQDSFMEIQSSFAKNAVIGLGRIEKATVGIVSNQPNYLGGSIDYNSSDKMARFVRFCDCFNIPIIVLVDVPAFLPGANQEKNGIIRHGAKMLYAFSEATVPKISLIIRKAYGGAYIAMNSKNMGADIVFAWPIAEIAVMGAEGAVNIIHRKEIKDNPQRQQELIDEYTDKFMNPYIAASFGFIDEIIRPEDTRKKITSALKMLKSKTEKKPWKKHGNIPL